MSRGAKTQEHVVFVYGTLLRGERNHQLLAEARFVCEAVTGPGFELADLGTFPAMLRGRSGGVSGEVYAVDSQTLAALDRLERHPHFYRRTRVTLTNGPCAEAYLLEAEHARGRPRIASGDWRRRRTQKGRR